jgi:hypothetical protein
VTLPPLSFQPSPCSTPNEHFQIFLLLNHCGKLDHWLLAPCSLLLASNCDL